LMKHSRLPSSTLRKQSASHWRMQNITQESVDSSDDEFFDAREVLEGKTAMLLGMSQWNSNDLVEQIETLGHIDQTQESLYRVRRLKCVPQTSIDGLEEAENKCQTHVLVLVVHGGNILDLAGGEAGAKTADVNTLSSVLEKVSQDHFQAAAQHVVIKLVPCPAVCAEAFCLVSNLNPYSYDESCVSSSVDHLPLAALPLLAIAAPHYQDAVATVIARANQVYHSFLQSPEGQGFTGQVCLMGDCVGGVLCFDALCFSNSPRHSSPIHTSRHNSTESLKDNPEVSPSLSSSKRLSRSNIDLSAPSETRNRKTPLSRKQSDSYDGDSSGSQHPPFLSRYLFLLQYFLHAETTPEESFFFVHYSCFFLVDWNVIIGMSLRWDYYFFYLFIYLFIEQCSWWGSKRLDYALYCPDVLTSFPTVALPHLFHASYWESTDVVAFLLRQVMHCDYVKAQEMDNSDSAPFSPSSPREKWLRRRTHVKLRNVTANHRVNDIIVTEDGRQTLVGRFMYGPLDMVTLTGEKVDVYVMTQPQSGRWKHLDTEMTNSSGRVTYTIPKSKKLAVGVYPIKMVVKGDQTSAEAFLTVLPRGMECVVFSIDGSFAASVSIMGSDPKVRPGAVDVVRHWQDLGYLIIYITGRPDMQKQRVVSWLSQHNFPQGMIFFSEGLVHDPLRQKTIFLRNLVQECHIKINCAYGSMKDISVYSMLGLNPNQIYIVGRPSKKYQNQCQFLSEGYAVHLSSLQFRARPKKSSSVRMVLRKGSFGLSAKPDFLCKRTHLRRTMSVQQPEPPMTPNPKPERAQSQPDPGALFRQQEQRRIQFLNSVSSMLHLSVMI
uniref:Membrane-associated phosphatidylinositol transfer protein 3 n=1 Tax=Sinocyclocheilus grahami TaxID=75366 RepID=A0A672KM57_SINGR